MTNDEIADQVAMLAIGKSPTPEHAMIMFSLFLAQLLMMGKGILKDGFEALMNDPKKFIDLTKDFLDRDMAEQKAKKS